ncbi:MAG: A/G-specific adenine glycosylase [Opitutales bacterium]|nr:A/G-specific adenine glycosylase [Opitutales bacterium]
MDRRSPSHAFPLETSSGLSESAVPEIRLSLLGWYSRSRRKLPWREDPSLYGTMVSEFMLQQTQVKTMLPYYERWMRQFPDPQSLADSAEAEVMKLWQGLGYYSRARNLQAAIRKLLSLPAPPRTAAEWESFPGVGPYMAAAIASISFGDPAAVVDGNVIRVISRLAGIKAPFSSNSQAVRVIRPFARHLLDPSTPGDFNQAIMELGALVCTPRQATCQKCPIQPNCLAFQTAAVEIIPSIQRAPTIDTKVFRLWLYDCTSDTLILELQQGKSRLSGLHELPAILIEPNDAPKFESLMVRTRTIGNNRIREHIVQPVDPFNLRTNENHGTLHQIPVADLESVGISGPHRKWIRELLKIQTSGFRASGEGSC